MHKKVGVSETINSELENESKKVDWGGRGI